MKQFNAPHAEIVRFGKMDIMTASCAVDCECVECLPCAEGDHCTYFDTCPTHCARDGQ